MARLKGAPEVATDPLRAFSLARNGASPSFRSRQTKLAPWLILGVYAVARILEVAGNGPPATFVVALDVLSAFAFVFAHGAPQYGLRGILAFCAICIVVSNSIENLGVATGLPYGRYYFTTLMGPKLFHVPILLGLAYIGMAYVSWSLARAILRDEKQGLGGRWVALPILASFIMVAWDLAQDPVWATLLHGWIWLDGGPWFGVPLSNYCGWFLTVFLIYLSFALYLRNRHGGPVASRASLRTAVLFYALCAAGNVAQTIPEPNPAVVNDLSGRQWRVADITAASALVSILVMGAFAAIAWVRASGAETPADLTTRSD